MLKILKERKQLCQQCHSYSPCVWCSNCCGKTYFAFKVCGSGTGTRVFRRSPVRVDPVLLLPLALCWQSFKALRSTVEILVCNSTVRSDSVLGLDKCTWCPLGQGVSLLRVSQGWRSPAKLAFLSFPRSKNMHGWGGVVFNSNRLPTAATAFTLVTVGRLFWQQLEPFYTLFLQNQISTVCISFPQAEKFGDNHHNFN